MWEDWVLTKSYGMTTASHNLVLENASEGQVLLDLGLEGLRHPDKVEEKDEATPAVGNTMSRAMETSPGKEERPS